MSNQLRLILERYIEVQPKANKLSLPLDRDLGDITRYKYVLAEALPLRMERLSSEQPNASALSLGMYQPLGTIAPPLYFISNSLPLPLTVATSEQPPSNSLPLNISRRLGTAVGVPVTPPDVADVNITVNAVASITPTANASVSVTEDDSVAVSVTAIADIAPIASATLSIESLDVAVTITATATLSPTASASASYDANNPRLAMLDVSSDIQNAKLQGIDRRSSFEANKNLTQQVTANWQQSKLIGAENQAQFESNEQLTSSSQLSFEQAKLIGDSSQQLLESLTFIASKSTLKNETAKRISHAQWYSFEAMAKRQIERAIKGENGKLLTDKLSSYNEYSYLLNTRTDFLIETARLPFSKLRYVPPPLSQTVILKEQIIEGWECGSGALRYYVYNDELALPMTRRIADRGASSNLAMPMTMPSGILMLSAIDADAMENRICKRKTLAVNPTLDVTMCKPKVFGKSSGIGVSANALFDAIAWLELLAEEKDSAYNKGVIFVTNSVSLNRSDDGREIKMLGFSVGIDSNSYTWSFSATVPLSELSKVDTAHEQQIGVEFVCNGNLWRFILDSCDDSVSFGESSLTIKGKSRAMLLANPYAAQRGFKYDTPMSARQIAEDELNRFGVPSGFTLDWQLAGANGWQIPANTYSYSNKTPINSLQWIAEAAGGFINADMSADILHVLAHYPTPSWEWSAQTPSINLPMSLITSRSRGRINKPAYNGVTVYGEREGSIGALIKRTGTSGGYQPPMVTSDLITDQDAAISRGKMILSDTGDIGNIGISMPLHTDIGVLKPSTLIGVNDGEQWVGMVRGTTITGRLSSNQALEIDQSIDVERHFDKEIV
ncbi:Ig-like domain-containing protein [Psychrobacter glaciei]|uniref:Ig-like domain-containing protein n=1 Tax=Psychrobacter glaciei TaxID=619771 RepID=UPI003F4466F6